jgi:hypothetical protein
MNNNSQNNSNSNSNQNGNTNTTGSATITTVTNTRVAVEARYQTLATALLANFESTDSLSLAGGTYLVSDLVSRLQGAIAAEEKAKVAKNQWLTDVKSARQGESDLAPVLKGIHRVLEGRYGEDSPKLAEFGFAPRKRTQPSTETKADAVVKRAATRKARHTMGKKQRLTVKAPVDASVPAVPTTTTPAPAGAASTPGPQTAAQAPAANPARSGTGTNNGGGS